MARRSTWKVNFGMFRVLCERSEGHVSVVPRVEQAAVGVREDERCGRWIGALQLPFEKFSGEAIRQMDFAETLWGLAEPEQAAEAGHFIMPKSLVNDERRIES
jgi:hypothetical protein